MAMESVSLPRDNSLEELRVVVEEKKQEAKKKFSELKKLLQISEDTTTNTLDKIYTDIREGIERNERTVTQLEQAKIALNSTLVDNNMTVLLQTTIRNFDTQIAEARNSACVVPKHILLRWKVEDLKQSIENVCEVISSTSEIPVYTLQPNKIELEGVRKELEQRTNEVVSLQEEKQDMQEKYQEEMSNSKLRVESLYKECSLLKMELQKRSGDSRHGSATKSAETEEHLVSLTTRIKELEDTLTAKDTHISQVYSELESIRIHYSNLEKELESLKSVNQPSSRNEGQLFSSNSNPQRIANTMMSQFMTIDGLEMDLTLKRSECDALQETVTSLQSELKEAQDLLASKLETPSKFDVDHVKIPKKQMKELEANTKYFKSEIPRLQNLLQVKETESAILRTNLDESRKELENTKLVLQQTMSNSVKVQSKEDLQTGSDVREKQAEYSQVAAKHKQHPKYIITNLHVHGKRTPFYTLDQVDNPSDLTGELVMCRSKYGHNNVIGTLKVVIPAKLKFEKTIAGIEFVDEFGDSSGTYRGIPYFKTKFKCALFLPTDEVFLNYDESSK